MQNEEITRLTDALELAKPRDHKLIKLRQVSQDSSSRPSTLPLGKIVQAASVLELVFPMTRFPLTNKAPRRVQCTRRRYLYPLRPLPPPEEPQIPAWLHQLDLDLDLRLQLRHLPRLRSGRVIRRADNGSRPFLASILERRRRTSSSIPTAFALISP
jgi:hypothetical protein